MLLSENEQLLWYVELCCPTCSSGHLGVYFFTDNILWNSFLCKCTLLNPLEQGSDMHFCLARLRVLSKIFRGRQYSLMPSMMQWQWGEQVHQTEAGQIVQGHTRSTHQRVHSGILGYSFITKGQIQRPRDACGTLPSDPTTVLSPACPKPNSNCWHSHWMWLSFRFGAGPPVVEDFNDPDTWEKFQSNIISV